jgi:hypothetical protein
VILAFYFYKFYLFSFDKISHYIQKNKKKNSQKKKIKINKTEELFSKILQRKNFYKNSQNSQLYNKIMKKKKINK